MLNRFVRQQGHKDALHAGIHFPGFENSQPYGVLSDHGSPGKNSREFKPILSISYGGIRW